MNDAYCPVLYYSYMSYTFLFVMHAGLHLTGLYYVIVDVGLRMWRHGLMIGLQDGTGTVLACRHLSGEMLHPFGLK